MPKVWELLEYSMGAAI